jgi:hypothetical protein
MNFQFKIFNFQRGQSLFELVVAIAISALIIVAIVSLTTNSIQNSNFSRNKALAATYAQEATEWLRGQRDGDVENFINTRAPIGITPAGYCLPDLSWGHFNANVTINCITPISGTILRRWVTFINVGLQNGKTVVETDVVVSWTDSQGTHEVVSATNLADLR